MENIASIRFFIYGFCFLFLLSLTEVMSTPLPSSLQPADNSTNTTHELLNEVIVGVRVLQRHSVSNILGSSLLTVSVAT